MRCGSLLIQESKKQTVTVSELELEPFMVIFLDLINVVGGCDRFLLDIRWCIFFCSILLLAQLKQNGVDFRSSRFQKFLINFYLNIAKKHYEKYKSHN